MHASLHELRLLGTDLTARKLWNAAKVAGSYYAARLLKRPVHWGLPIAVGIEPTTACNLGCPHCPSGLKAFTRPTGRLSLERFKAVVNELGPDMLYLILYFQGEPYLNPQFLDMVEYASQRKVHTMTSTNAHFLSPMAAARTVAAGLGRIVVSLDGASQASYEKYRLHGSFDKAVEGANNLLSARRAAKARRPFVDLQFIVFRHNQHEVEAVRQIGKKLGVNRVSIKTAQIYDYENADGWIPDDSRLARYAKDPDGRYRIKNELLNHCWKLWHGAEITWDGRVLPCCFDKDAQNEMGRFPETSFSEIWRGQAYKSFRERLLKGRESIGICQNCTAGTRVWA